MGERYWDVWDEDRLKYYIQTYGESDNPTLSHLARMKLCAQLITGKTVLDVGCGIGHLYHVLPKDTQYTGVDSSPHMVKYARKHGGGNFVVGDAYDLSEFDTHETVVCQSLLIHLPDIVEPIKQMWGKTGRELIFSIPIGRRSQVKTWRQYKDKSVLSHIETMDSINGILSGLPNYEKHYYTLEPKSKLRNMYFKVTK